MSGQSLYEGEGEGSGWSFPCHLNEEVDNRGLDLLIGIRESIEEEIKQTA